MDPKLAHSLIELSRDLGIKDIVLIGGEPTLWQHLFETADFISASGMDSCLITNALRLASPDYAARLDASAINHVVVSVKAGSAEKYRETTRSGNFEKVKQSLRNAARLKKDVSVSIVMSSAVANELDRLVDLAVECGLERMMISFCTTTFLDDIPSKNYMIDPREAAATILKHFDKMDRACGGRLVIEQSLPACAWPKSELDHLRERHKISAGCHVMMRNGLVFDPRGNVLPCNCLHGYPMGTYGDDFSDPLSFRKFWQGSIVQGVLDRLAALPSRECDTCREYEDCGGGCPLHWFVMDPSDIIRAQEAQ